MNKYAKIILWIIGVFVLSTCSKSPFCKSKSENKGIIINSVNMGCRVKPGYSQTVIDSDSAMKAQFDTVTSKCTLPNIDFTQYTILGAVSSAGGCGEIQKYKEVKRIDDEQRYHYFIKMRGCGNCKMLAISYNYVLVPKLPQGWKVTFEVDDE